MNYDVLERMKFEPFFWTETCFSGDGFHYTVMHLKPTTPDLDLGVSGSPHIRRAATYFDAYLLPYQIEAEKRAKDNAEDPVNKVTYSHKGKPEWFPLERKRDIESRLLDCELLLPSELVGGFFYEIYDGYATVNESTRFGKKAARFYRIWSQLNDDTGDLLLSMTYLKPLEKRMRIEALRAAMALMINK